MLQAMLQARTSTTFADYTRPVIINIYLQNTAKDLHSRCVLLSIRPRHVPYREPTASIIRPLFLFLGVYDPSTFGPGGPTKTRLRPSIQGLNPKFDLY